MERAVTIALVTETVDRVGLGGSVTAGGLVNAPLRGRELRELVGGPARPRDELAAAVRTFARQHGRSARPAERALERADHRLGRIRRQIAITALAARTQL